VLLRGGQAVWVLITYDVATATPGGERRLRRVARACEDYGQRVQLSVFECRVEAKDWALLRQRLLSEMDPREDSLRVYFLDAGVQVEHQGVKEPISLEGPLVI
jgi:CRISPR-associated protein Cas2